MTEQILQTLTIVRTGRVAIVTVNRPEVLNALSLEVQIDLATALDELRSDEQVGAVVFTGAGDRAFAAGADIQRLRAYTRETALASRMQRLFDEIETFEKPTIAAVNGFALGGGCELAMACDIRVASERARFGLPETGLGIIPGAGGTQRLARLAGVGIALDLILTGRTLTAQEALAVGLVTRVVGETDLLANCCEVGETMLSRGPLALSLARIVVRAGVNVDQATGQVLEQLAQAVLYETQDKQEGVDAFLDKRAPEFTRR